MKWHAVWQGVLSGLSMMVAAGSLTDVAGQHWAGFAAAFVASLQAGTSGYYAAQNRTTLSATTIVTPGGHPQ